MEKQDHKESFLLCQFQSLMSHIDNLISSSTMRINSILLIWAFTIPALTLLLSRNSNLSELKEIIILVGLFLFITGTNIYCLQIMSSVKILFYYRIINRIRKMYGDIDSDLKEILLGLPFTENEPGNIFRIFDPGIVLILLLNSISLFLVSYFLFKRIVFYLLLLALTLILKILFLKVYKRWELAKLKNA